MSLPLQHGLRAFNHTLRRFIVAHQSGHVEGHGYALLRRGAGFYCIHPALERIEPIDGYARPAISSHPTPVGDVGDGVVRASQPFALLQAAVEYFEKPTALILIAVDGGLVDLVPIAEENVSLSHHGADATHLEHQPLQGAAPSLLIGRQKPAGFFREINHDRAGLKDGKIVLVTVYDGRDTPIWINL